MPLALDIADIADLATPVAQAGALRTHEHIVGETLDSTVALVALIYDSSHGG